MKLILIIIYVVHVLNHGLNVAINRLKIVNVIILDIISGLNVNQETIFLNLDYLEVHIVKNQ
jgi:hypothetical protein